MKKKSKKNSTKESADGNRNVDRAVADFFDESIKQIRQISHRIKAGKAVDTEGAILRRRKSATVSTLALGADDFVYKPMPPKVVATRVRYVMARYRHFYMYRNKE